MKDSGQVTQLLGEVRRGNQGAVNELMQVVYAELHRRAASYMKNERRGHTLQPTALVNEAYLRLIDQKQASFNDRSHFYALAARTMRRILVEHARSRKAQIRGGDRQRVPLEEGLLQTKNSEIDVLALDEAIRKVELHSSRMGKVIEMRFFGGLSVEEVGTVLSVDPATVKRDWKTAKAMLFNELGRNGSTGKADGQG